MTKKEQAALEAALTQAALRATSPQMPDIPQGSWETLTKGWLPIAASTSSARVEPACSRGSFHAIGSTVKTDRQGGRSLYSSRLVALRQLRYEAEQDAASHLRRIDRMIEQEIENPTPLPRLPQNERNHPMTPEQLDHLRRIDAHLANLLAIAEKRTPGEWAITKLGDNPESYPGIEAVLTEENIVDNHYAYEGGGVNGMHNAAFIASCAGNAEAGWKATRAVIKSYYDSSICREWQGYMQSAIEPILAAFPNI